MHIEEGRNKGFGQSADPGTIYIAEADGGSCFPTGKKEIAKGHASETDIEIHVQKKTRTYFHIVETR